MQGGILRRAAVIGVLLRTLVVSGARLAGEAHVQVDGLAQDLARQRLRLNVVLRNAHQPEKGDWHQHLAGHAQLSEMRTAS